MLKHIKSNWRTTIAGFALLAFAGFVFYSKLDNSIGYMLAIAGAGLVASKDPSKIKP
jgi:hypothetical protein